MPPIEALGFGLPVLTSREASIPEVTMGLATYLDDARDPVEMADKLSGLLDDGADARPSPDDVARVRQAYDPADIGARYRACWRPHERRARSSCCRCRDRARPWPSACSPHIRRSRRPPSPGCCCPTCTPRVSAASRPSTRSPSRHAPSRSSCARCRTGNETTERPSTTSRSTCTHALRTMARPTSSTRRLGITTSSTTCSRRSPTRSSSSCGGTRSRSWRRSSRRGRKAGGTSIDGAETCAASRRSSMPTAVTVRPRWRCATKTSSAIRSPRGPRSSTPSTFPSTRDLLTSFSDVRLEGSMGDPTGVHRYDTISEEPLEKWRSTLANPYRKRWCREYLRWIGGERLAVMGYELDELLAELDELGTLPARSPPTRSTADTGRWRSGANDRPSSGWRRGFADRRPRGRRRPSERRLAQRHRDRVEAEDRHRARRAGQALG